MKIGRAHLPLSELRIRAKRLLKNLRSTDVEAARSAAERFRQLELLAHRGPGRILASREAIRLKHALAVVAHEQGFASWATLKNAVEAAAPPSRQSTSSREDGRLMYARDFDVLLNRWFARYQDARASRQEMGGFLFPYDRQFFVCEAEGVRLLGLDPEDPDWQRIGWDWVEPADRPAWERLRRKRLAAKGADITQHEHGKTRTGRPPQVSDAETGKAHRKALKRQYKESRRPMGAYQIRNTRNGKILVGVSRDLPAIFNRHRAQLRMRSHANQALQQDWDELGPKVFVFETLDTLPSEEYRGEDMSADLRALEELWLEKLKPFAERGYNARPRPTRQLPR